MVHQMSDLEGIHLAKLDSCQVGMETKDKEINKALSNAGPSCKVDGNAAGTVGEGFGCFLLEAPTTEGRRFLVFSGSCCCFEVAAEGV